MPTVMQIVAAPTPLAGQKVGVNGPERRAANLASRWESAGVRAVVCYPKRGRLWNEFARARVDLIDFEIGHKFNLRAVFTIKRLIGERAVDVLHTQGPGSLDALATLAGNMSRNPVVVTRPVMLEELITISRLRRRLYAFFDRFTISRASRLVAVSKAGRNHLIGVARADPDKVDLIHNGIDLERFSPDPAGETQTDTGAPQTHVEIGMVAQLTRPKGWVDFVNVIAQLREWKCDVKGLVVGGGPLEGAICDEIRSRGLENTIQMVGFRRDVLPLLRRMDLFLFTSHREGLSVAVLEAMAVGLPIVATDVGGIREQVEEGRNGFLASAGDCGRLARHCRRLVEDPVSLKSFGRESRCMAEDRFSEDRMFEQYLQCYYEVTNADRVACPGSPAGVS